MNDNIGLNDRILFNEKQTFSGMLELFKKITVLIDIWKAFMIWYVLSENLIEL